MKLTALLTTLLAMATVARSTLAGDYPDLVAQGYRWSLVDGPYAYATKEDAKVGGSRFAKMPLTEIVDHAYFLRPGKLVLVVEADAAAGISKIRVGGITADLWTRTTNLSTHPVMDTLGIVETPYTTINMKILPAAPSPSSSDTPAGSTSPSPTATP